MGRTGHLSEAPACVRLEAKLPLSRVPSAVLGPCAGISALFYRPSVGKAAENKWFLIPMRGSEPWYPYHGPGGRCHVSDPHEG